MATKQEELETKIVFGYGGLILLATLIFGMKGFVYTIGITILLAILMLPIYLTIGGIAVLFKFDKWIWKK